VVTKPRRQAVAKGIYIEEARGRRMNGRWGPWVPIDSLSRSRVYAVYAVQPSSEYWQFRAVLYVPAKEQP
jgi:hypothetical protein